jgi:3-methyladenine DNA glycosylase AlkC
MPEPFKNLLNPALVRDAGAHLQRVWPAFDRPRFEKLALKGLAGLEMKARAMQIADALEATLPADFADAAAIIEATLAPAPPPGDDSFGVRSGDHGLAGWIGWPLGEFIARRGVASEIDAQRALAALHALTQRFTGEFAIRTLILAHPQLAFATLQRWTTDPSPHVRRLASEGSRPRLPWGLQLKPLIVDPAPTAAILRALLDDDSAYVRRSVANHLNDIARDHPGVFADWLDEHLPAAPPERRALLKHASRTLLKKGDSRVLQAWGLGAPLRGDATFAIAPKKATIGGQVMLELTLHSRTKATQRLAIDYLVHHVRANGGTSAKVFKGWVLELGAGETRTLAKQHSLKPVTTRVLYPGRHRVQVQANGVVIAEASFVLEKGDVLR